MKHLTPKARSGHGRRRVAGAPGGGQAQPQLSAPARRRVARDLEVGGRELAMMTRNDGASCLLISAKKGHLEVVKALLEVRVIVRPFQNHRVVRAEGDFGFASTAQQTIKA